MLDKSVEYAQFLMKRKAGSPVIEFGLPEGFSFVYYKPGDERYWAEIKAAVTEFPDEEKAMEYFRGEFSPHIGETQRRCVFIEDRDGKKIATATAWMSNQNGEPMMHWVSVRPEYQGLGLGKAVVSKAFHRLLELNGDADIYLITQTWSYKAVDIYKKFGFGFSRETGIHGFRNDNFDRAMEILTQIESNS